MNRSGSLRGFRAVETVEARIGVLVERRQCEPLEMSRETLREVCRSRAICGVAVAVRVERDRLRDLESRGWIASQVVRRDRFPRRRLHPQTEWPKRESPPSRDTSRRRIRRRALRRLSKVGTAPRPNEKLVSQEMTK